MKLLMLTITYGLSYFLSGEGIYLPAGGLLLVTALLLYGLYYRESGMLLSPPALFSLSWIGGIGLSAMKLSHLQTDWEKETWLCFYLIYAAFILAYEGTERLFSKGEKAPFFTAKFREPGTQCEGDTLILCTRTDAKQGSASLKQTEAKCESDTPVFSVKTDVKLLARLISGLCYLSLTAFLFEALTLSYIPLFTVDTPHAYSEFHITGVHYFTVSCVLIPSLSVLYWNALGKEGGEELKRGKWDKTSKCVLLFTAISLLIPVLCVSRFQLILAVLLMVFTLLLIKRSRFSDLFRRKESRWLLLLLFALAAAYIFLTVERAHSISYLNGIFEMKWDKMPIFITQPYMYVANNFDNFNCLIRDLPAHTGGLRMLFPVFALSGLKFLSPELVSFPLYVTKEELTTVTLFYDAYYDFGVIGCIAFAAVLGLLMAVLKQKVWNRHPKEPLFYLIAAELLFYLLFAFFTTWYSNPTTWFYLAVSLFMYCYMRFMRKRKHI